MKEVSRTVTTGKPGIVTVEPGTGRAQTRPVSTDIANETVPLDL